MSLPEYGGLTLAQELQLLQKVAQDSFSAKVRTSLLVHDYVFNLIENTVRFRSACYVGYE